MNITSNRISTALAFIVFVLFLLSFTANSNAQTLYSCERGGDDPFLHTINPNTGATLSTIEITLPGTQVTGCNGMAKHPLTGTCYIMLNTQGSTTDPRTLAIIDPDTGEATLIGGANQTFASIAFSADGRLYGVTGDGASIPETLFIININNGSTTEVTTLGNGEDGEAIAYNFNNDLMYHTSGISTINVDNIFESINLANNSLSPITISGDTSIWNEQTALVQSSPNVFLTAQRGSNLILHSITTSGVVTQIGPMDHVSKGLAFDCGIPTIASAVPTMSEWGLIAVVIMLGFVSLIVLRKRSAFQK